MAWDGVPEHRNLHGDDEPSTLGPAERLEYMRRIIKASGREQPQSDPGMPPDPFNGLLSSSIAMAEILQSLIDGGFTESQALYYLACLSHVGLAIRTGQFGPDLPPPPQEEAP